MVAKEQVYNELKKVMDPELHISIVDLGLIYEVEVKDSQADVLMTLTFPGCPLGSIIHQEINEKLATLRGVEKINLKITFDPPWDFSKVSEVAKQELGII